MRARAIAGSVLLGSALLASRVGGHESQSAKFRNLSGGAATAAAAPVAAPAPAAPRPAPAAPRPAPRAAPALAAAAPAAPPAAPPAPGSAPWLWAAGASLALAGAFALARRPRRDESLALAAHELKSPLSAIEAYLALMEQDGRSGAAPDARAWLEDVARMRTTAAHLRRTIGDMLEMTRLEDGRLRLEPRSFDLAALARECAQSYGALAEQHGLTLRVEGGPAPAWADPARARQVLDNLIGNALRHAAARGTVVVNCEGGPRARVSVADDGAGVPAERRAKLFQRFSRLSAPARGETGTGLGLYIGRRLAEASGGRLEHAPAPGGRGAVFTFELPGARS